MTNDDDKAKTTNIALIAVAVIGVIAILGLIVAMFIPGLNDGSREVTAALTAIVSAAVGGLIFLMKKDPPSQPVVVVTEDTEKKP